MAKFEVFDQYCEKYDLWFEENKNLYLSELQAIQELIPKQGRGLEVGVGTGRFAVPLNIETGVEPSDSMAQLAEKRGIKVYSAQAEGLPFQNSEFDFVLMVTVICFVDDINKAFLEAYRVLKKQGQIIVAFIDRKSGLGQLYEMEKQNSIFFKEAAFYSANEVTQYLKKTGFANLEFRQTIFKEQPDALHPVKIGFGEGSFVVVKATKGAGFQAENSVRGWLYG